MRFLLLHNISPKNLASVAPIDLSIMMNAFTFAGFSFPMRKSEKVLIHFMFKEAIKVCLNLYLHITPRLLMFFVTPTEIEAVNIDFLADL